MFMELFFCSLFLLAFLSTFESMTHLITIKISYNQPYAT